MKQRKYNTNKPCLVCGQSQEGMVCLHHIKTRGSGGPDEPWNLMPLCFICHHSIHSMPLTKFVEKNNNVKEWLIQNGWEVINGKWKNFKRMHVDVDKK